MAEDLIRKLKLAENDVILTIGAPPDFKQTLGELPAGARISKITNDFTQVHWFVKDKRQMEAELRDVLSKVKGDVICWIYFPKATSGIQTDLTRDKGWDKLLAHKDMKWLSLVSLNETWSGFAMRRKNAGDKAPADREIFNWIDVEKRIVKIPPVLEEAFAKNKKALQNFEALSFTNRKEYVEWIVTAKREETRNTRVEGTIDRLVKGWKNPRNT